MPKLKTEQFGPGDQTWIGPGSAGIAGRTEWMDTADFAGKATNGVVPSGTALALVAGQLKPYDAAAGTDASKLIGFLLTDQPVSAGRIGVPVFDHGRVQVKNLPEAFTPPATVSDLTRVVYVGSGA